MYTKVHIHAPEEIQEKIHNMSGSSYGQLFRVTTWGESHGQGIGAVVDGCPAGLSLSEEDIQVYLDRRRPGTSRFTTARQEADRVRIMSGIFDRRTTGTPISLVIENTNQHSGDYGNIAHTYRPGHADFGYDSKYGFRDYRGGGRSSGRETAGRVAAGAIALKLLSELGISIRAYVSSIGDIEINRESMDLGITNALCMPDIDAYERASEYLDKLRSEGDSSGAVIECVVDGMPTGVGEPVFDKLDAELAKAVMSIGAVKGVEIGDGFSVSRMRGSENNDSMYMGADGGVNFRTNHSGGVLGGISNGNRVFIRAAVKPTPSIYKCQHTVNDTGEDVDIEIEGRHDPIIAPRAVVVVEAMTAIVIADLMMRSCTDTVDKLKLITGK